MNPSGKSPADPEPVPVERRGVEPTRILLFLLLTFLAGYRLLLAQSGQLYWPDESRYGHALHLLDELRKGHPVAGLGWMFGGYTGARPSFVLLSTVPAAIQGIANVLFGVDPSSPTFYRIPAAANVLITLALAAVFFRFLLAAVHDRWFALLGTLVYSLLANANLYVRHLFPYDLALLLLLGSLVLLFTERASAGRLRTRAIAAGIISGIAYTTYPGYDPFILILVAALLANPVGSWRHVTLLGASTLLVLLFWEGIARVAGSTFIEASFRFSGTVAAARQGSFEETFRFLPVYLLEHDGIVGAALLVFAGLFAVRALGGRYGRLEGVVIGTACAIYLAYATVGEVFKQTLYYGRVLHMYMPFLVFAAILAVQGLKNRTARRVVATALAVASVASFVPTAAVALAIEFPKDVEREVAASWPGDEICRTAADGADRFAGITDACDLVLENTRHLYPIPRDLESSPPPGFVLLKTWRHPLQFRPYVYEGHNIQERARLQAHPPEIRLYRRIDRAGESPAARRPH